MLTAQRKRVIERVTNATETVKELTQDKLVTISPTTQTNTLDKVFPVAAESFTETEDSLDDNPFANLPSMGEPQSKLKAPLRDKARFGLEAAKAELLEIRIAKLKGELVDAESVRKAWFAHGKMIRDHLMTLPRILAEQTLACKDAREAESKIRNALIDALETLSTLPGERNE